MDHYAGGKEEIDRYSLRGRVFNKIREDILAGNTGKRMNFGRQ